MQEKIITRRSIIELLQLKPQGSPRKIFSDAEYNFSFGLERKWDCNPCIPDEYWKQVNFSMPSKLRNHRGSVWYQREHCSKVCRELTTQGLNLYRADEGNDSWRASAQRKSSLHDTADTTDRRCVLRRADAESGEPRTATKSDKKIRGDKFWKGQFIKRKRKCRCSWLCWTWQICLEYLARAHTNSLDKRTFPSWKSCKDAR